MRVCLSVSEHRPMSELLVRSSPSFYASYTRLWLGPPSAELRYVVYFRFTDDVIYVHNRRREKSVYIAWSDVTEYIVTIRSPCCGYNLARCVELLKAKIYGVIRIKLNQLVYKNVRTITSLPVKHLSAITVASIFPRFTHKMAAKTSRNEITSVSPYIYSK